MPLHNGLFAARTHAIIGAAFRVHNVLGGGLTEEIYKNALAIEFSKRRIPFVRESRIRVLYDSRFVGTVFADFLCHDEILLEVKAVRQLDDSHEMQLKGYMKSARNPLGLLLNFGPARVDVSRLIISAFAREGA